MAVSAGSDGVIFVAVGTDEFSEADAEAYFGQVYPGYPIEWIEGIPGLKKKLSDEPREHVVLFAHGECDSSKGSQVRFGGPKRTLEWLVDQLKTQPDPMPSVARWTFENCEVGRSPVDVFRFARALGIGRVEAWTALHAVASWTVSGSGEELRDAVCLMAPYVAGPDHAERSSAVLCQQLLPSGGRVMVEMLVMASKADPKRCMANLVAAQEVQLKTDPKVTDHWKRVCGDLGLWPVPKAPTIRVTSRKQAEHSMADARSQRGPSRVVVELPPGP